MPRKSRNIIVVSKPKRTRAPTAYNMFMKKTLPEVRAANPGVKQKEIMKMAAQLWRTHKGSGYYQPR